MLSMAFNSARRSIFHSVPLLSEMASAPLPVRSLTAVVPFPDSAQYLPAFSRLPKCIMNPLDIAQSILSELNLIRTFSLDRHGIGI